MRKGGVLAVLCAILLLGMACEENNYFVDGNTSYRVSGTVLAWECYQGYPYSWPGSHLFPDRTEGDSALVTFVRLNGNSYSLYTDAAASFDVVLDEGPYMVIIESRWTLPDTVFNVNITKDTELHLNVVLWVLDPVNLRISFFYHSGDSLGAQWEWDRIRVMNGVLRNKLSISGFVPPDSVLAFRDDGVLFGGLPYAEWVIPIRSPGYHIFDVYRELDEYLRRVTSDSIEIGTYPRGAYICR